MCTDTQIGYSTQTHTLSVEEAVYYASRLYYQTVRENRRDRENWRVFACALLHYGVFPSFHLYSSNEKIRAFYLLLLLSDVIAVVVVAAVVVVLSFYFLMWVFDDFGYVLTVVVFVVSLFRPIVYAFVVGWLIVFSVRRIVLPLCMWIFFATYNFTPARQTEWLYKRCIYIYMYIHIMCMFCTDPTL